MKKIEIVRDNTTNKNLANVVVARVKTMIERFVSPRASRSPTTLNIESTMYNLNTYRCPRRPRPNLLIARASRINQVVDDLERTIDNDPPEGNVYDLPRHVRASAALKDINARLNDLEASKRIYHKSSCPAINIQQQEQQEQFRDVSSSSSAATPARLPATAAPRPTNPRFLPPRRQGTRSPPRQRESPLPQDPIAESAAKDDARLIRRMTKLMRELPSDDPSDSAERGFDLAHNARSGMICMPGDTHDQDTHQAVFQLLDSADLRQLQEYFVNMNQIITVSRELNQYYPLMSHSANTGRKESS